MGPDWLGSPQHFVAGAVIAAFVALGPLRPVLPTWVTLVLGVGAAMTAESVWEFFEYQLRYAGHLRATAYWDTIADLTATFVGACTAVALFEADAARRHHLRGRG